MTKKFPFNRVLASIGLILVFLVSCQPEEKEKPKIKEGILTFEVTYPYYRDNFMASLLPDEMTMTFKDNVYKNYITKGGLFSTSVISDCNNEILILTLDFGPKKIYTKLDKALTDTMLLMYATPDIIMMNEYDSIAGFNCERKMAVFDDLADGYDVELFETEDIEIKNSNWCNQYKDIENVLLGYEIGQYGLQSRMRAISFDDSTKVTSKDFEVPDNFKEVPLDRMLYEMEEIFKSLVE